jgi:hypothetical protein
MKRKRANGMAEEYSTVEKEIEEFTNEYECLKSI